MLGQEQVQRFFLSATGPCHIAAGANGAHAVQSERTIASMQVLWSVGSNWLPILHTGKGAISVTETASASAAIRVAVAVSFSGTGPGASERLFRR